MWWPENISTVVITISSMLVLTPVGVPETDTVFSVLLQYWFQVLRLPHCTTNTAILWNLPVSDKITQFLRKGRCSPRLFAVKRPSSASANTPATTEGNSGACWLAALRPHTHGGHLTAGVDGALPFRDSSTKCFAVSRTNFTDSNPDSTTFWSHELKFLYIQNEKNVPTSQTFRELTHAKDLGEGLLLVPKQNAFKIWVSCLFLGLHDRRKTPRLILSLPTTWYFATFVTLLLKIVSCHRTSDLGRSLESLICEDTRV